MRSVVWRLLVILMTVVYRVGSLTGVGSRRTGRNKKQQMQKTWTRVSLFSRHIVTVIFMTFGSGAELKVGLSDKCVWPGILTIYPVLLCFILLGERFLLLLCVLLTVLLLFYDTMTKVTYESWGLAYSFRDVVHGHHGRSIA